LSRRTGSIKKGEISLQDIISHAKKREEVKEAGVIACFIGTVRRKGHDGSEVQYLEYEAYEDVVGKQLAKLREDLCKKFRLVDLYIYHVIDKLNVGDEIVYIVVISEHRKEALEALREAVDKIKFEVAIWKKEVTKKGETWIST
jgi:molybdopterin synthase catalytic subunit